MRQSIEALFGNEPVESEGGGINETGEREGGGMHETVESEGGGIHETVEMEIRWRRRSIGRNLGLALFSRCLPYVDV
jgi:hypothetical protein